MSYVVEPGVDPQEVRRRRRLAEALLQQGSDTSPILSPWQGAARMAQGLMGGYELGLEDKRDRETLAAQKAQDAQFNDMLSRTYGGGTSTVSGALGAGKPVFGPIKLDGFDSSLARTLQFEGGVNPSDTNGTPSVMGINQKANPDVDLNRVQSDPAYRANIYKTRYWDPIGADKMDPRLAHVAFDTSVLAGPGKAKELLAASGGDPEKFMALREQFLSSLQARSPEKFNKYAQAYANRNATLRADIGVNPGGMFAVGGGGQSTMAGGSDTLQPTKVASADMATAMQLLQRARTPQQMAIAKQMLEQAQKANDPNRALQMEKARLEIDRLKNPQAPEAARKLEIINQQRQAAGLPPLRLDEYETTLRKAGSTSVNVGGGSDKQIFDAIESDAKEARSAVTGLQAIQEARKAIAGGGIFGAGADARLGLQKVGALLGVTDPKVIQNTETFRAAIAPQVSAMLKATVGTSQISNTDREFAEKAAGGSITLDEGSIKRLLDIMEKAGRGRIESYQKRLDTVYPDGPEGKFARERALFGLTGIPEPMPEPATQTGQPLPRKSVGGKTYEKRADGWYEVK